MHEQEKTSNCNGRPHTLQLKVISPPRRLENQLGSLRQPFGLTGCAIGLPLQGFVLRLSCAPGAVLFIESGSLTDRLREGYNCLLVSKEALQFSLRQGQGAGIQYP